MVSQYTLSLINTFIQFFIAFVILFTFRGFFETVCAMLMGDSTAKDEGYLTLNPLTHIDPIGLSIMLLLALMISSLLGFSPRGIIPLIMCSLGIRWSFPIPIDSSQFKSHRLGGIITCLSGSFGLFLISFISLAVFKILLRSSNSPTVAATCLSLFLTISETGIFFGVLDLLIPIPPLNGGRLLYYLLPYNKQYIVDWLEHYSLILIMVLLFSPILGDTVIHGLNLISFLIKKLMFSALFFI